MCSNKDSIEKSTDVFGTMKIMTTTVASVVGAFLTYPSEMYRISFTTKELAAWSFDTSQQRNTLVEEISKHFEQKQKVRMILSPLFRLTSHEIALSATSGIMTNTALTSNHFTSSSEGLGCFMREIIAGALAGTSQALLLCPLEAWKANEVRKVEEEAHKSWKKWIRSQLFGDGSGDPLERQTRVYRGVGVLAAREVIFNVSFFPLFYGTRRYLNDSYHTQNISPTDFPPSKVAIINMFASGIFAGAVCSLVVTPMDILKTWYFHSREKWSFWSGAKVVAPPLQLLMRGLTIQAFVFGPTFGVVASIYELA